MVIFGEDNKTGEELLTVNEPDISNEPVRWWISSNELPNFVEPL